MAKAERLLIVEDDALVAGMMTIVLGKAGFICDVAESENSAVDKYKTGNTSGVTYSAVIYDLILNEDCIAGLKACRRIKDFDPEAKGILCTGFSDNPITVSFREFGFDRCLQKPFSGRDLQSIVAELVKATDGGNHAESDPRPVNKQF